MRVDVRADHQVTAAFLREYLERRLRFVLGRFGPKVSRIAIEVGDVNGPRGGVDKFCRIKADITGLSGVFAESADSDIRVAIDRAAGRIERVVGRTISRARTRTGETVRKSVEIEELG